MRGNVADYFQAMQALAERQGGFFYPWTSTLDGEDGEGAYGRLVMQHLTPEAVVLEAGCGHGPDIPRFAPQVARYIAYDAVDGFLAAARRTLSEKGLANVELVCANSSPRFNDGRARVPARDASVDLIVSRRGPTNWIADAPRVCRPGARLIQLNPLAAVPAWNETLPEALRMADEGDVAARIAELLAGAGLAVERDWTFDVVETFARPVDFHVFLTFTRPQPYADARTVLERLFADHAGPEGLEIRRRRYLWTATVP